MCLCVCFLSPFVSVCMLFVSDCVCLYMRNSVCPHKYISLMVCVCVYRSCSSWPTLLTARETCLPSVPKGNTSHSLPSTQCIVSSIATTTSSSSSVSHSSSSFSTSSYMYMLPSPFYPPTIGYMMFCCSSPNQCCPSRTHVVHTCRHMH